MNDKLLSCDFCQRSDFDDHNELELHLQTCKPKKELPASQEYVTTLLTSIFALQERVDYLQDIAEGARYADMLVATAELMEAVGDMIEDESVCVPIAVQMAFDNLDKIIIDLLGGE